MSSSYQENKAEIVSDIQQEKAKYTMGMYKPTTKTILGDWEEVYSVQDVTETLWTENSAFLKETKYYQTFGGGPEGGYFVMSDSMVWKVKRSWFQPWTTEPIKNTILEYEPADEMAGKVARCRLIEVIDLRETRKIIDNHILWGNAIEIVKALRDGLGRAGDASYKDLCLGIVLHHFTYIDKYLDLLPSDSCPSYKEVLQDLVKRQEEGSDSEESSDESDSGSDSESEEEVVCCKKKIKTSDIIRSSEGTNICKDCWT